MVQPLGGAPTKYREEYCEKLIEHMASGFSYESFAGLIRVSRTTMNTWEAIHDEWKEAKEIAFGCCRLFWEDQGIRGMYATKSHDVETGKIIERASINAPVWIMNMKARFAWRDRVEVTGNGSTDPQKPVSRLVIQMPEESEDTQDTTLKVA